MASVGSGNRTEMAPAWTSLLAPRICLGSNFFRICHQPIVTSAFRPRHALTLQEIAAQGLPRGGSRNSRGGGGESRNSSNLPPPPVMKSQIFHCSQPVFLVSLVSSVTSLLLDNWIENSHIRWNFTCWLGITCG